MYINKNIDEIIEKNSMDFSQYVIKNRALPDLYSGMKPIHLKILWSMFENKTFNYTKSANVSGKVMVYSPHGDCYETIVNMVQNNRHIYNLIQGQGNWGSFCSTEMQYGASRYTECKMSPLGIDCMQGIAKNMVDMIDNYDNSHKMPKYLPTRFPLILCMASNGIAVGMANNSPSFNLEEVCKATISYLQGEDIPFLYPDFATGGHIIDDEEVIRNINLSGRGSMTLRAKYEIRDNMIIITEIPYGTKINIESIINKITEKHKSGQLKEIINASNQTGIDGLSVEITCKKGTDMNAIINKLFALTPLESKFSANMNVLLEGKPLVLGVHDTIKEWCKFRYQCIVNGIQFDINKLQDELHLLHGLKKVLLDIDKTIDIIRHSSNVETELMTYFNIDQVQTNNIVNMKLKNINKEFIIKQINEIEGMDRKLNELKQMINNPNSINNIIIEDLEDCIKKFAQPRRTQIISPDTIQDITKDDLITDNSVSFLLTSDGYIKKTLKFTNNESHKIKDNDTILQNFATTNKTDLLLFTDKNRVFIRKTYDVPECNSPSQSLGEYIPNFLKGYIEEDEKIIYITTTKDYKGTLCTLYENGQISKTALSSFTTKQNRQVPMDAYTNENGKLIDLKVLTDDCDILMITNEGKALITNSSQINEKKSRKNNGSKGINLKDDNIVIGGLIGYDENLKFTIITEKGKTREYLIDDVADNSDKSWTDYLRGKRGNQGNFIWNSRQKKDKIVEVKFE